MFVTWYERAIPRRETAWAGRPVMSPPLNRICPADGGRTPVSRLKNVVLPAPLGPMTERSSPSTHLEVDAVDGGEAAEDLGQPSALQQHAVDARARAVRAGAAGSGTARRVLRSAPRGGGPASRVSVPTMPSGRKSTISTKAPPTNTSQYSRCLLRKSRIQMNTPAPTNGPSSVPGAAEQRHDQDGARHRPVDVLDRHELQHDGEKGAGQPREEAGDRERHQLHAAGVVAAGGRARLVGLHRPHRPPERRAPARGGSTSMATTMIAAIT